MCLVCSDWLKGNITTKEAWRNFFEMAENPDKTEEELDHEAVVANMLAGGKDEDPKK